MQQMLPPGTPSRTLSSAMSEWYLSQRHSRFLGRAGPMLCFCGLKTTSGRIAKSATVRCAFSHGAAVQCKPEVLKIVIGTATGRFGHLYHVRRSSMKCKKRCPIQRTAKRRRATSADATSCSPQGKRSSLQPMHRQMHSWRRHSGQRLCTEFSGRTFQHPRAQVHSVALHGAGGRAVGSSSYTWKFPTQSVLLDVSDGASSSG